MKPWYEQSFGKDYMIVYRHRDWEHANQEVRKMAKWLSLPEQASVLDIGCGMGRHSLALSEAGFNVTGVDLSDTLLEEARAHDCDDRVKWKDGDMRELPFADESFDATFNLFTSFGYFSLEEDNERVIQQIRRVLRKGGAFLIDFLNPVYVEQNLVARSERFDDSCGLSIVEKRWITGGWVQKEITVYEPHEPEHARQYLERVRLYSLEWFEKRYEVCGLRLEQLYGNYDGTHYNEEQSPRMIMAGSAL
ncbi:class I SAM-dependent methyltransferase [Paenibacillus paeoniae]|uniref:Class I SAM-dependent methyltransferase n=1 Tax=Paenibacillus paeoniae TaxID=2292705 RepID=A0A371PJE2_9BACL|nr:class I SAM-dependent methyltransferase [Paenibacillus paeoniae]REK75887.1 class I SAM-dependent methyltransferase [Paenibacillus paeoniae]